MGGEGKTETYYRQKNRILLLKEILYHAVRRASPAVAIEKLICYAIAMPIRIHKDKPWAKLRMTRRKYEACRPWKYVGMSREAFEVLLPQIPDERIEEMYLDIDAERLIENVFKGV